MKKMLLAAALATASVAAYAHPSSNVHYHDDNRVPVYSRTFEPTTETTFEYDAQGRRIRVETTTRCVQPRINPNNKHLRCLREEISTNRFYDNPRQPDVARPVIAPIVHHSEERDHRGRLVHVTTTYTCTDARWSPNRREALCYNWEASVHREFVREQPYEQSRGGANSVEDLVIEGFRGILESR